MEAAACTIDTQLPRLKREVIRCTLVLGFSIIPNTLVGQEWFRYKESLFTERSWFKWIGCHAKVAKKKYTIQCCDLYFLWNYFSQSDHGLIGLFVSQRSQSAQRKNTQSGCDICRVYDNLNIDYRVLKLSIKYLSKSVKLSTDYKIASDRLRRSNLTI